MGGNKVRELNEGLCLGDVLWLLLFLWANRTWCSCSVSRMRDLAGPSKWMLQGLYVSFYMWRFVCVGRTPWTNQKEPLVQCPSKYHMFSQLLSILSPQVQLCCSFTFILQHACPHLPPPEPPSAAFVIVFLLLFLVVKPR